MDCSRGLLWRLLLPDCIGEPAFSAVGAFTAHRRGAWTRVRLWLHGTMGRRGLAPRYNMTCDDETIAQKDALAAALAYRPLGSSVIPLEPGSKRSLNRSESLPTILLRR